MFEYFLEGEKEKYHNAGNNIFFKNPPFFSHISLVIMFFWPNLGDYLIHTIVHKRGKKEVKKYFGVTTTEGL